MMRSIGLVLVVVILVNLLAAAGFVGWLGYSGRLSEGRLKRAAAIFEPTIAQQQAQQRKADQLAAQARDKSKAAAHLAAVADGPRTFNDLLARRQQTNELTRQRAERLGREAKDLSRQIDQAKQRLSKRKQQLDADRAKFEKRVQARIKQQKDADFKHAVKMYEQLKPLQTKQMFQQLLNRDQLGQVVDYLAAMQTRKAGAVLKEFKTPAEIAQATALVEALRQRGLDPLGRGGGAGHDARSKPQPTQTASAP